MTRFQVFQRELLTSPPNLSSSCLFLPVTEEHSHQKNNQRSPLSGH